MQRLDGRERNGELRERLHVRVHLRIQLQPRLREHFELHRPLRDRCLAEDLHGIRDVFVKLARAAALVLVFSSGCGSTGVGRDGNVVGGPCTSSQSCAGGSSCLTATMYPGGTCSVHCTTQADCPDHSVCVTETGGQCVLPCASASDCRAGYACTDRSTPTGHALVCML